MSEQKKYWWNDKADIGSYDFCYGGTWDYDFYVFEVAVKFDNLSERERESRFQGAKFAWGGCSGGVAYLNEPLKADNIEDAKREFEAWYEARLAKRVENLKEAIVDATKEYELFLKYKQESGKSELVIPNLKEEAG